MSDVTTFVIEAAERIRLRLQRSGEDVVAIGHDLIAVREMLGAERFQDWIAEEFNMSRTTAYRFIAVAERFPNPTVGLSLTALYELAAPGTPDDVVEAVTERAQQGESIPASEIRRLRQEVREVEEAETPAPPPHRVLPPRPKESPSSHADEVSECLASWERARPSARNEFLALIGAVIPTQDPVVVAYVETQDAAQSDA